jgi:signal transduction histidine kinase
MWVVAAAGTGSVLATVPLSLVYAGLPGLLILLGFPLPYVVIGLFAWWRAPGHLVARRMLGTSAVLAAATLSVDLSHVLPSSSLWPWLVNALYGLLLVMVVQLVALLPDGRYWFTHERIVLRALWLWPPWYSLPYLIDTPWGTARPVEGLWLLLLGPVLLAVRYESLPADQRRALRWLVSMALLGVAALTVPLLLEQWVPQTRSSAAPLGWLVIAAVAAALVVAVTRHRLLGVDLDIRWTTRYGLVWLIFGLCVLTVAGFVSATKESVLPLAAVVVVLAVAYAARVSVELAARVTQIRRQARELAASRTRIVHAQDIERRRIERHLHDGVQQELVALVAKLRLARNRLPKGAERTGVLLGEVQDDMYRVIDELRELAHGIHPAELTDQGLTAAVRSRARRVPIPVTVLADPALDGTRHAADIEESAYFLVSEALTNVLKHARASQVVIRLTRVDGSLVVEITDDGIGIPRDQRDGLTTLRDRIGAVGGSLEVTGGPGEGTTVRARLPALEAIDD